MECVADTSVISRLEKVEYLWLLPKIYDRIYAPPAVFRELEPHLPTKEFVTNTLTPITFKSEKERRRFDSLVRRWSKKVNLEDVADVEVFVGYKFFTDADEAVYSNKGAENRLSTYGKVRDIYSLYKLAEEQGIFTREDSIKYLKSLLNLIPPYRPKEVKGALEELIKLR